MLLTKEETELGKRFKNYIEKEVPIMWTKKYDKASINSNDYSVSTDYSTTTTGYEGGFVPKPFLHGEALTSLLEKYKGKKIGEILENTHVYKRIIRYWVLYTLVVDNNMYPYV